MKDEGQNFIDACEFPRRYSRTGFIQILTLCIYRRVKGCVSIPIIRGNSTMLSAGRNHIPWMVGMVNSNDIAHRAFSTAARLRRIEDVGCLPSRVVPRYQGVR